MKNIVSKKKSFGNYFKEKEYIANMYVMRCFFLCMIFYGICFLLNLLGLFIVDKELMLMGGIPSVIIYLVMVVATKVFSLSSEKMKYFILLSIVSVLTCIGISITYHVILLAVLPILFSVLYSSKKVMWYVYFLTVISTIITVYVGYYHGLCDANMALLTNTKLENYLQSGQFVLTKLNSNPKVTLMLFFIIPRCLIYISVMIVCNSIFKIIKAGFEEAEVIVQMEVFQKELKNKVDEQTLELLEQQRKLKESYMQTVIALSEAVDAKDRYTSGHSKRVAKYSKMIAKKMGKTEQEQEMIYRAGLLHDVGKIGVPAEIINKPGKLTENEFDLIKVHPITGYHILREISEYSDMAVAIKYHHEHYNGNGYPNGLAGEGIPEYSRILGVADSYDAMTSNRSYRKRLPQDIVRNEIEKSKGTQFDPKIADIMIQMIDEDKDYVLRQFDSMEYNILIIGDDEKNNRRIKNIIQEEHIYEVSVASDLQDVIGKLERHQIDLIILDIQKNQSKYWEMHQKIKDIYKIPTVLMSDDNNLRNTKEFKDFGYEDYLIKSCSALMIKEMVYNMTKNCK